MPSIPKDWIAGEAIADAVNFANDFRELFEQEKLVDLPTSVPQDATECVLARAFNFDCEVDTEGGEWVVRFSEYGDLDLIEEARQRAVSLGKILNTNPKIRTWGLDDEYEDVGTPEISATVPLPEHIGAIAYAFDNYMLEEKYYVGSDEAEEIY